MDLHEWEMKSNQQEKKNQERGIVLRFFPLFFYLFVCGVASPDEMILFMVVRSGLLLLFAMNVCCYCSQR